MFGLSRMAYLSSKTNTPAKLDEYAAYAATHSTTAKISVVTDAGRDRSAAGAAERAAGRRVFFRDGMTATRSPSFHAARGPLLRRTARAIEQIRDRRPRPYDRDHLEREERSAETNQRPIQTQQKPRRRAIAERERKGRRHARHPDHGEARLVEQPPERAEREEPRVRQIEDAALAVVELSQQQHHAHDAKRDVARAGDDRHVR